MPKPKTVDLDSLLDESGTAFPKGHDIGSVGPSDSSDTGADMVGVGGLDQAEEAQLGVTDEEIDAAVRDRLGLDK